MSDFEILFIISTESLMISYVDFKCVLIQESLPHKPLLDDTI